MPAIIKRVVPDAAAARTAIASHDNAAAERYLTHAIAVDPASFEAHAMLAHTDGSTGDVARARSTLEQFADRNPNDAAPRTALGFKDGGKTLVLATWDGPGGTGHGGIGIDREAADLAARGVQTAVNLDGGGSTTMVARALGEDAVSVRNNPSDGHERNDPNGVGVFVAPGDGKVHQVLLEPAAGQAAADGGVKVFPGMHRTFTAKAVDDHLTPVAVDSRKKVRRFVIQAPVGEVCALPGVSIESRGMHRRRCGRSRADRWRPSRSGSTC